MRRLAILGAVVAAAAFAPGRAHAQTQVTCESVNGRQNVCSMDTSGGVRLVRYLSLTPCVEGQNWGVTRGGIWVSGGCRGTFATNGVAAGSGRYGRYDRNGRYNDTYDNNNYGNTWNNNALATADNLCRQAIRQRLGNRRLSTSVLQNNNRNNVRLAWQSSNGHAGTCRVNRNGNVTVSMER
ncbi:MAG TPA: DUF3011 domain-containing protein [Longimicrobium sp.]|nr:DUF3011 domain-containing protein [Longimicrobium sp.]